MIPEYTLQIGLYKHIHIVLKHHIVIIEYEGHSYVITYARTRLALPIKFPLMKYHHRPTVEEQLE